MKNKLRKRLVGVICTVAMLLFAEVSPFSVLSSEFSFPIEATTEDNTNQTYSSVYSETDNEFESDADYRQLSFELFPNGEEVEKTVTLNGMMPEGASATAVDVTEDYSDIDSFNAYNEDTLEEEQAVSVLAAYDITIQDGENEYQPDQSRPIMVEITDPEITENGITALWHIKADGQREKITDFTVENGKISFYATGFSVYAIVVEESVVPQDDSRTGWQKISSTDELSAYGAGSSGLYISHVDGYYLTNEPYTVSGSRTGIKKTSKNNIDMAIANGAVPYYFEEAGEGKFYIYCLNDSNKKYVKQSSNSLSFVDASSDATAFTVEPHTNADAKDFYILGNDGYCWNMQGGNSGQGFAAFNNTVDTNARLYLWYYVPLDNDPYELDGKTYGLMNFSGGTSGNALMADETNNYLPLLDLVLRTESKSGTFYVSENQDISMWTFHSVSEDKYTLSAEVDGEIKYLKIDDSGLSFVDKDNASEIKVTPGSGTRKGKIKLSAGDKTVAYDSDNGFTSVTAVSDSDNLWLNFVEVSALTQSDYLTYSADKISVSEVTNRQSVIVYTRVWNDTQKAYEFYAVDHDGSLVRCYERGDNIMWLGSQINTLMWDFTEYYYEGTTDPNYYYELYNPYSKKYLAPQIKDGQILSDSKIGINLPGRKDGEYYTDILAWDDEYYAYAGIKADTASDKIVSCPKSKAETFYFATIETPVPQLTTVDTIDNTQYGITMKIIDYPDRAYQANVIGNDEGNFKQGLLSTNLKENGYPTATNGEKSLFELYSGATEVNHLFIKSTYETSGYYEFDSCQNFATLKVTNDGNFTVYKELGTTDIQEKPTLKHGQFFPYDTITAGSYAVTNSENLYSALASMTDYSIGILPDTDPRKYEKLYTVGNSPNYYNGMELEAGFVQTPSGKDAWGHDIIFEFTGDDDFWLYVDGELVIDLGGIHSALAGNVNFATGDVVVDGSQTTLRALFESNYKARNPEATELEIKDYLDKYFEDGENVFKDYSSHTMKIFYMERGAGASNLHMRFNLSYVTPGHVILTKEVSGTEDIDFSLVQYPYQIWYKDQNGGDAKLLENDNEHIRVTYQNSMQKVDYKETYTPPGSSVPYESVYFLNPSQSAEIHFPENTIEYKIVECGINTEVYDRVCVNGVEIDGVSEGGTNRKKYDSGWISVKNRPNIVFDNHVNPDGLRTLSIEKKLYDETGKLLTSEEDSTTFSFRLYLSNGVDDNLHLADMYKYRVKDSSGNYCKWDAENQRFVSTEKTSYSQFTTEEEQETVTFETSMNGSISKIPAGYKIEVPNLPVGTKFMLEERESEIPLGYKLIGYEREQGSFYNSGDGDTPNSGRVRANESPSMTVKNKRGWGLSVNKIWSDKNFTTSHDPIYTAVYVNNVLLEGTVRQITSPDTSVRYFFDSLKDGHSFDDYEIKEVELTNPVVDSDGNVTSYNSIKVLNDGDSININAVLVNEKSLTFSYAVTYEKGTVQKTASDVSGKGNVRTDTITNARSGGVVITLYEMDSKNELSDGVFILKQDDDIIGTYTSDAHGRVTILYDFIPGEDYVLTEIAAPKGYIGLPKPVTFSIATDNTVKVSGNAQEWADWCPPDSGNHLIAYINVYNKPFTLKAVKYDSETNVPLSGAHFALYRSVSGLGGEVKDYNPISEYEDLETDEDGVIPKIDNSLAPGKYYLTETTPPANYEKLSEDVIFTISVLGDVTIDSANGVTIDSENNTCSYVINIPNTKVNSMSNLTITKAVRGSIGSKTKEFTFTLEIEGADNAAEYSWTKNKVEQEVKLKNHGTFTLKDSDIVTILLPNNSHITITEDSEGYDAEFKLGEDAAEHVKEKTFNLTEDTELNVTNTLNGILPTGINANFSAVAVVFLSIFVCVAFVLNRKKKYRRKE